MGVSKNSGTPKSSTLIGFSIINHPFLGTIIFGNTLMCIVYQIPGTRMTPILIGGWKGLLFGGFCSASK